MPRPIILSDRLLDTFINMGCEVLVAAKKQLSLFSEDSNAEVLYDMQAETFSFQNTEGEPLETPKVKAVRSRRIECD